MRWFLCIGATAVALTIAVLPSWSAAGDDGPITSLPGAARAAAPHAAPARSDRVALVGQVESGPDAPAVTRSGGGGGLPVPAAVRAKVAVYSALGPDAERVVHQHLLENYEGTLEWMVRPDRGALIDGSLARRTAIELARDRIKLEHFERGWFWIVGLANDERTAPTVDDFALEDHDICFVRTVVDDDGIAKSVVCYLPHEHPLMVNAMRVTD